MIVHRRSASTYPMMPMSPSVNMTPERAAGVFRFRERDAARNHAQYSFGADGLFDTWMLSTIDSVSANVMYPPAPLVTT
jgi:hypothetical protein